MNLSGSEDLPTYYETLEDLNLHLHNCDTLKPSLLLVSKKIFLATLDVNNFFLQKRIVYFHNHFMNSDKTVSFFSVEGRFPRGKYHRYDLKK